MKHIKAISCLLLSTMVLTVFCGCDGSREESGVSDAMSGTCSVVSEAISDVSAEESRESPEEISMESFGEESGVMSGAEESSEEEPSGEESSEEEFSEEEYSGVELSEYVENAEDYTYIHYGEEGNGVYVLAKYNGTDEYIRIPSEYKGEPVTFIGDSPSGDLPFGDNIKGVIIPASCKGTMWGAFSACTSLESAVCAGDDPIEFGLFCFAGCNALKRLVLPKNQEYLPRSFLPGPGTQLKTLRLPDGLKSDPNITLYEAGKAGTVFIVRRGSVAEKTLADYNAGDWGTTPIKYTVTD